MAPESTVDVIIISGRSGVGKSTVANEVHSLLAQGEVPHAHLEGDNLDQTFPEESGPKLFLCNLESIWRNFVELRGCRTLLLNGSAIVLDFDAIQEVIKRVSAKCGGSTKPPQLRMKAFILTASDDTAFGRLKEREIGSTLDAHVQSSKRVSRLLADVEDSRVEHVTTNDRSVHEIASDVLKRFYRNVETPA